MDITKTPVLLPKIYIAATYEHRARIKLDVVPRFNELAIVNSSWLEINESIPGGIGTDTNFAIQCANQDMLDIECSEIVFIETEPVTPGKYFEFGYAVRADKRIVLIGRLWSVFHSLGRFRKYESWDKFFDAVGAGRFKFKLNEGHRDYKTGYGVTGVTRV